MEPTVSAYRDLPNILFGNHFTKANFNDFIVSPQVLLYMNLDRFHVKICVADILTQMKILNIICILYLTRRG
jgi:hypothetical protein